MEKWLGVIFGVLVILNALILIPTIGIFAVLTFSLAGVSIIMNQLTK